MRWLSKIQSASGLWRIGDGAPSDASVPIRSDVPGKLRRFRFEFWFHFLLTRTVLEKLNVPFFCRPRRKVRRGATSDQDLGNGFKPVNNWKSDVLPEGISVLSAILVPWAFHYCSYPPLIRDVSWLNPARSLVSSEVRCICWARTTPPHMIISYYSNLSVYIIEMKCPCKFSNTWYHFAWRPSLEGRASGPQLPRPYRASTEPGPRASKAFSFSRPAGWHCELFPPWRAGLQVIIFCKL